MAELEARREARRRKILENSERRLNKISGVEEKNTKTDIDGMRFSSTYAERDDGLLLSNITQSMGPKYDKLPTIKQNSNSVPEVTTIFQNPSINENESVFNYSIENTETRNKNIFIVVLPLILSIILVSFDLLKIDIRSTYFNKIFIPLLVYEIREYIIGSSDNSVPGILTSLLTLSNARNSFITVYVQYLQYFVKILQDLTVYFFIFILSHKFLTFLLL